MQLVYFTARGVPYLEARGTCPPPHKALRCGRETWRIAIEVPGHAFSVYIYLTNGNIDRLKTPDFC